MPQKAPEPTGEIILCPTEDGRARVECRFAGDTVWLTQALIAELYQKDVRTINEHLQNAFQDGEIEPGATIRKFRMVRREGQRNVTLLIEHYSLDAILSRRVSGPLTPGRPVPAVGHRAAQRIPRQGIRDGRPAAEEPAVEGSGRPDYFDELLERIRDIRASEKRMYLRVREIFALAGGLCRFREVAKQQATP